MKKCLYYYIILLISLNILHIDCYHFSVIMAIYNTGRYLDQSIGSLLKQTIGYKEIQIILINDGSTDNSEEICLKYQKLYPDNIIYLKTQNNGVSKARNIGILLAKGEFINFLDPDDYWDSKAFEYVLSFFKLNNQINFISGRLKFFEARNEYHPLDYKFYKTRIVNLTEEYNCIQSSSSTSFFRSSYIAGKKFPEGILCGEDTRFVNELLLKNPIMGLVREAIYFCRKRIDFTSRTQTQKKDLEFYFSTINNVSQYLIDESIKIYNKVLPFIQYYLAYDVLFRIETLSFKYLNSSNYFKYCNLIENILKNIDDKYIIEQKYINNKFKIVALSKKYNKDLRYDIIFENGTLKYSGQILIDLLDFRKVIIWKKIIIENDKLHLEGEDNLWIPKDKYFYFCISGNNTFLPKTEYYSKNDFYSLFGLVDKGKIIIFDIPLENIEKQTIYIYFSFINNNFEIFPIPGYFTSLPVINSGYHISGNYIIKNVEKRLTIYKYNEIIENSFEHQYCKQLKKLRKYEIIKLRRANRKYIRKLKNKGYKNEIWILNDKRQQAGDNGEFFFRYLRTKNPKGVEVYFAIQKNCPDYQRLKNLGNILDINSVEYLKIFLKSDKLISSVDDLWVDNPFGGDHQYIKDLFQFIFIFLQNGIIKDDLSKNTDSLRRKIDLIISSTEREYNSLLSTNYGFNKDNIVLTGLSRYDNLYKYNKNEIKKNNRMILVMPTWRLSIKGNKDSLIYESIHSDAFKLTQFFNFYNSLINDQELIKVMKQYNYTGVFCLHQYFAAQWIDFTKNSQFVIKDICNYQDLLIQGSLLITDYSSIFFDFGYLKKPIIYTQFDYEEFRLNQYPEGYFSYKNDGFGPIYFDINSSVNSIINSIKNNCQLNNKYLRRINSFFTFFDEHNNDRIYEQIMRRSNMEGKNFSNIPSINLIIYFTIFFILKIIKLYYYFSN